LAVVTILLASTSLEAQRSSTEGAKLTIPFTTTGTSNGAMVDVAGTFTITQFGTTTNGQLAAQGTLATTIRDIVGLRSVVTQLVVPATAMGGAAGSPGVITQQVPCGLLHVELAPLNLEAQGLMLNLNRLGLDISAAPGQASVAGNLLCSIAGLMNGGSVATTQTPTQLAILLNQLIAAL
jgi:hypothetical protein